MGQRIDVTKAPKEAEIQRTQQLYAYERQYGAQGFLVGIDEVGRGPLAGPVCAGAVILPTDHMVYYLNDSKKLSEKKREALYDLILEEAVAVSVAFREPERIDAINILEATKEAMADAVEQVVVQLQTKGFDEERVGALLIDAVQIRQLQRFQQVSIIKGDAKSASIAAASIVAKVTRDRLMANLDVRYPGYGFAKNKGYGTAEHMAALREKGPTPIHRRSFLKNILGT